MIKQHIHKPLFVYLAQNNWPVGSAYKYFTVLKAHFDGMLLSNKGDDFAGTNIGVITSFKSSIKRLKPDLIFCRGDWLRYYEMAIDAEIPYVLIEQDVHSLRSNLLPRQIAKEKLMIESAAGIIFTSEDHLAYCQEQYEVPDNYVIVHLRPLLQDLAWLPKEKLPGKHLVYAGGIIKNAPGSKYGYRCYKRIFKAFVDAGWTVHIYGSKNQYDTVSKYARENKGIVPHGWFTYPKLLQEMSQYTAGLQAYAKVDVSDRAFAYTQSCRPNKTWDYLAAGIPTIGLYPGNCAKIYQDGGWGIVVPDTKRSTLENIELPSFSKSLRFEQVMDNDLAKFEKVIGLALKLDEKETKNHWKEEGEKKVGVEGKHWFRLEKAVMENGRLLHGRGKRIPLSEAIRLGLYRKETVKKEQIKKRIERKKEKKAKEELLVEKPKVTIEVKPLVEPPEVKEYRRPKKISVPAILEVNKKVEEHKTDSKKKERDN